MLHTRYIIHDIVFAEEKWFFFKGICKYKLFTQKSENVGINAAQSIWLMIVTIEV